MRRPRVKAFARIPPNLRFRIPRDFESPWSLGEDSWDLIHLRMGYGSISSWQEMYHNIFRHVHRILEVTMGRWKIEKKCS